MSDERIWQAKLAARIHDPAEKALVLLRDPAGHEGGTVRTLREKLFPSDAWGWVEAIVKKADHWASAADRPQFPREKDDNLFARWAQVRFTEAPELKHPLTGGSFNLKTLQEIDFEQVKAVSGDHFENLIQYEGEIINWKKTVLAFWRFGPELGGEGLRLLWQLLPADTRVPDHTIWSHLDLASALAGAIAGDAQGTP
ncbi:type III-B CRISPR-associated protein Cas10/Cmr2, partial [Candidatus Parcubacteria bacterium]